MEKVLSFDRVKSITSGRKKTVPSNNAIYSLSKAGGATCTEAAGQSFGGENIIIKKTAVQRMGRQRPLAAERQAILNTTVETSYMLLARDLR